MRANTSPLGSFPRRTARWIAIAMWIACLFAAQKAVVDVLNNEFKLIYVVLMLLCFGLAVAYTLIWRHAKPDPVED
jgi:dolichyl-phosphate-mannose--protein O-mannosyl transferase